MPWNKGFSKNTHPSVMKISQTMRDKHIDNFAQWREKMRKIGKIPNSSSALLHSSELAEFIGVMLGDGNLTRYPRTEGLLIFSNANNPGFVQHYAELTEKLFKKKPAIRKVKNVNCVRISLYQKNISKRLQIPIVSRAHFTLQVPNWIWEKRIYSLFFKGIV